MLINNINSNLSICQQLKFKNSKIPWNLQNPLPKSMGALGVIHASHDSYIKVLNILISFSFKYKTVYAKQDTLAKASKVSLSTFKRALIFWQEQGFIAKKNNGYNKSCWYKVSSWFNNPDIQKQLAKKLTIFFFSVTQLLSCFEPVNYDVPYVFNFIYKTSYKQPITKEIVGRKEDNQRKILKKKGSMFEAQVESRDVIKNLGIEFSIDQQQQLSKYTDHQLLAAKQIINKRKITRSPAILFFWLLRNEPTVINALEKTNEQPKEKKIIYHPVHPPSPWTSVSYEKNLENFGLWYESHAKDYANYIKKTPEKLSKEFLFRLDNLFKDSLKIEDHRKNSKLYQESSLFTNIKPQIRQNLNGIVVEQSNTHNSEKDSTTVKFNSIFDNEQYYIQEEVFD